MPSSINNWLHKLTQYIKSQGSIFLYKSSEMRGANSIRNVGTLNLSTQEAEMGEPLCV